MIFKSNLLVKSHIHRPFTSIVMRAGMVVLMSFSLSAFAQTVEKSGIGRHAIKSFNLEKQDPVDKTPPNLGIGDMARDAAAASIELLQSGSDGRIQLFSVARLSPEDMSNPFEIRVQVRVDVKEIQIQIGGIVEGANGKRNTALIFVKPPRTVTKEEVKRREDGGVVDTPQNQGNGAGKNYLCSVGDSLEGFTVLEIRRDAVVLEMLEKRMEVTRGQLVTVCIPLSSIN